MLEFVQRHTDASTEHHLAGSSVHVDLAFLRRGMPRLAAHVPYRVVVRLAVRSEHNPVRIRLDALPRSWSLQSLLQHSSGTDAAYKPRFNIPNALPVAPCEPTKHHPARLTAADCLHRCCSSAV